MVRCLRLSAALVTPSLSRSTIHWRSRPTKHRPRRSLLHRLRQALRPRSTLRPPPHRSGRPWRVMTGRSAMARARPTPGPTPSHTYAAVGTYTVTLTVTDNADCSTSLVFTGQTVAATAVPAHQGDAPGSNRGAAKAPRSRRRPPQRPTRRGRWSTRASAAARAPAARISSCHDQAGRASGAQLDTSTTGSHTFTVTATSTDGQSATASVTYAPLRARQPRTSERHRSGARYRFEQVVHARYACLDGSSGPGVSSCARHGRRWSSDRHLQSRPARLRRPLTPRTERAPPAPPRTRCCQTTTSRSPMSRSTPTGRSRSRPSYPERERWLVFGTAWKNNVAETTRLLQPAPRRFVYGRAHRSRAAAALYPSD